MFARTSIIFCIIVMQACLSVARDRMHARRITSADGLTHSHVNSICETPDGQVWIGTWNGLMRCGNGKTEGIRSDRNGLRIGRVKDLRPTPDGNVTYVNEDGKRMTLDTKSLTVSECRSAPDRPAAREETCRYTVDDDGLAIERRGACYRIPFGKTSNEGHRLRVHYEDSRGSVWLNFNNAVYHLTFTPSPFCYAGFWDGKAAMPFRATVRAIATDSRGRLVAGGKDSMLYGLTEAPLRLNDDVYGIAADPRGGLWAGLRASGLCHVAPDGRVTYHTETGMAPLSQVFTLLRVGTTLYVGTRDNGLWALDIADRQRPRVKAHAADSAMVHSLSLLRNGNIAVCTSRGFWICTPGLGVVSRPSERHNVICAAELPDGTILLSTNGHGMMRQSHGKSLGLPKALRTIDSYALNMAWGPDSSLWMVTDDKLMRYSFGEDRLDVFGAADFGENLTFSESQCCIFQDSLLYVGAIPGMMEVDVKAIDRYVEARDDGGGTKPWHGAIAVAAAVATALGAALACKRRKKAKAAPQRYGVAPAKPEVVGADTAFVARLNSVLNSVIADADADIDSIASSMNMTRNMLFQRCSETLGATPAALLQRMRMERACQLFDAGERRIKEVAWQTGFNDPKYFAKVFKKTKGMTPTQYVENQREKGGK